MFGLSFFKQRHRGCDYNARMSQLEEIIVKSGEQQIETIENELAVEKMALFKSIEEKKKDIDNDFALKEIELIKEKNIYLSRFSNSKRLEKLRHLDNLILDMMKEAHLRLTKVDSKSCRKAYRRVLYILLLQCLTKICEPVVTVRFRKVDLHMGMSIFEKVIQKFLFLSGINVTMSLDEENHLPIECCGGVEVFSKNGQIIVSNSLAARLDIVCGRIYPLIRKSLLNENIQRTLSAPSKEDYIENNSKLCDSLLHVC